MQTAVNKVGTPGMVVGGLRRIAASSDLISKRGSMTISAPDAIDRFNATVMAKTWKNGSTASARSRPGSMPGNQRTHCSVLAVRF